MNEFDDIEKLLSEPVSSHAEQNTTERSSERIDEIQTAARTKTTQKQLEGLPKALIQEFSSSIFPALIKSFFPCARKQTTPKIINHEP